MQYGGPGRRILRLPGWLDDRRRIFTHSLQHPDAPL